MKKERASFSGSLGYILAVAGSAVGLGNIWRFPYLAAKYGGGMFLLVYLILMVTFGYALIISETALGRMTGKSPVGAFRKLTDKKWIRVGGWMNAIIPMLIAPYYCVIGGWVTKYFFECLAGNAHQLAQDGYFTDFIADSGSVEFWFLVFVVLVFLVIIGGVKNGIEKISKIMMPLLVLLAIVISIYSVTRPGAMAGVKYLFIPSMEHFSMMTIVAAMGQMFYSLSIAMGVLYTYGSYLKKDVDIAKSTAQLEVFDSAIALLAGLMIIPAVFSFSGGDTATLQAGPALMFITIPKVFESMGMANIVGCVFFLMVLVAALTSAISLTETSVSTLLDEFGGKRNSKCGVMFVIVVVLGSASALGYGALDFVQLFGMTVLDFFDFITNSVMMPIAALFTCILVVKVIGCKKIEEEITASSSFKRRRGYEMIIKYFVPVCLVVILVSSIANTLGLIKM